MVDPERTDCCSRSACGLSRFNACGHVDCGRAGADDLTFSQSRPAADSLSEVASRSLKAHHRLPFARAAVGTAGPIALDSSVPPGRASLVGSPGVTPSQSCGSNASFRAARVIGGFLLPSSTRSFAGAKGGRLITWQSPTCHDCQHGLRSGASKVSGT